MPENCFLLFKERIVFNVLCFHSFNFFKLREIENKEISILKMYVTEENGSFNPKRILMD